jgi:hypothetical protein
VYAHEYSGVDRGTALDTETSSTGTTRAMNTSSVTTAGASLLFSGAASSHRVTAAGPDYTTRSTAFDNRTMDRISFAAGSASASATQDSDFWVQHLVAFKSAASPGSAN